METLSMIGKRPFQGGVSPVQSVQFIGECNEFILVLREFNTHRAIPQVVHFFNTLAAFIAESLALGTIFHRRSTDSQESTPVFGQSFRWRSATPVGFVSQAR
jgi:hypothetical protein